MAMYEPATCYELRDDDREAPPVSTTRSSGVTLLELLVTLTLAAIVATVAIPAFTSLVQNLRMTSLANTTLGSLQSARSEAIRQNAHVSLCPSANGETCDETASYNDGWLMVAGSEPFKDTPRVLRVFPPTSESIEVRMRFSSGFDGALRYTPRGMIQTPNGGRISGSVWLCHEGEDRRIAINFVGRPRLAREPCRN